MGSAGGMPIPGGPFPWGPRTTAAPSSRDPAGPPHPPFLFFVEPFLERLDLEEELRHRGCDVGVCTM